MPIRTEDEHRAAQAHLTERLVVMRSRAFTDDEQSEFDALVRDIDAYQARHAGTPTPESLSAPLVAPPSGQPADGPKAETSLAGANMKRMLQRQGITPTASSVATSSMERTLRSMGLNRQGGR